METENIPQVITLDLIREMRHRGKGTEAERLLKKFREEIKKVKKQTLSTIRRRDSRIKIHFGTCRNYSCNNSVIEGKKVCKSCYESKQRTRQKEKEKRIQTRKEKKKRFLGGQKNERRKS